ncbi:hypothetical protein [Algibacter mikhailovii]|uniref:Lipoprotein n=1 Tax=Algibacter mikhailovii TaxID=425498 RepID=A0A918RDM2_9FLAO|nr:hypothetical protein [Algibacter mikhailovii]GGZ94375.1 hypothetical protein GCM10007028_35910 [Algibacter mikhailovii]
MKRLLTLFLILTIFSCERKEITKADLSFKLISWGSFYGAEREQIEKFEKLFDSIRKNPNAQKQDKELDDFFLRLKDKGLFTSPYINLRIGADSTLVVYLSETEYKKVKDFNHNDLQKRNKKVELELEIVKKDVDIYYAERILSVNEVDGQTYWKK